MMICLLLVFLCALGQTRANIENTIPEPNSCICVETASGVNMRDIPCGTVIGAAADRTCYRYGDDNEWCDLTEPHQFFKLDWQSGGYASGKYLIYGTDFDCGGSPPPAPDPEFRAAFMATAWNIDWPGSGFDSTGVQQADMLAYLELLASANMNSLIFQVRTSGDAFYASSHEPWSRYLTGTQGVAPSPYYDPLSFTITEAYNRGIEVHAWLNPYRANLTPDWAGLAVSHACNDPIIRPYCYPYDNYLWMDPGAPVVVDHLVNVITDIITNYPGLAGIHFDDYFYPYPDGTQFPDSQTYQDYTEGGGSLSRDDWRRDNVNQMISRVYSTIGGLSSTVAFSISPFGIYRPGHADGMPPPIAGLDPYTEQYADTKLWLQNGWVDFFAPQIYWDIDSSGQPFTDILDWWLSVNPLNRNIYAAQAYYKMTDANDWLMSEIVDQITVTRDSARRTAWGLGTIGYSIQYLRDDAKGLYTELQTNVFPTSANTPSMVWKGLRVPDSPDVDADGWKLLWDDVDNISYWFLVYKKVGDNWEMLAKLPLHVRSYEVSSCGVYAVATVNRANQMSQLAWVSVGSPDAQG